MKIKLVFFFILLTLQSYSSEVSIIAVGDIMLGRYVAKDLSDKDNNYPFEQIKELIQDADISFANLECTISSRGEKQEKEYCFRAEPKVVEGLKNVGFDILSLANNHIMDYGNDALFDTINLLNENGIFTVGAGENLDFSRKAVIIDCNDIKIAFLAYNCTYPETYNAQVDKPGACPGKIEIITEDIYRTKEKADIIIVSFHWGIEYEEYPEKWQIKLAHQTIDAGSELIIGHHPHVLQGFEIYNGKPIFYSLGNFIFDQNQNETQEGMAVKIVFQDEDNFTLYGFPIICDSYYPRLAKGEEKDRIILHFLEISKKLNIVQQNLNLVLFKK
jgi:poly-gamma-glutamate synthesis protein (capsule biosynthesis protein)